MFMGGSESYAIKVSTNGHWEHQVISKSETVTLTSDVLLDGPIVIQKGATLTIERSGDQTNIRIKPSESAYKSLNSTYPTCLFYVSEGGKLIIKGDSSDQYFISIIGNEAGSSVWTNLFDENSGANLTLSESFHATGGTYLKASNYIDFANGGLIYAVGSVEIENVRLYGMHSKNNTPAGAIYRPEQTGDGYKYGSINIKNSRITHNSSKHGAAILVNSQVRNQSDLEKNTPTSCAIMLDNVHISNNYTVTFDWNGKITNSASAAVYTHQNSVGNIKCKNCKIYDNVTTGMGAALYWNARASKDTKLTFSGTEIYRNHSYSNGGALFIEGSVTFEETMTTIRDNVADCEGDGAGNGGGAYLRTLGLAASDFNPAINMNLNQYVTFRNNQAVNGGAISLNMVREPVLAPGTVVNFDISGAQITGNTASFSGGGIYLVNDNTKLKTSFTLSGTTLIQNNTAGGFGGGIYCEKGSAMSDPSISPIKFNAGSILGNTASRSGGGVYVSGLNITSDSNASGITVSSNKSAENGGGICVIGYDNTTSFSVSNGIIGGDNEGDANVAVTGAGLYIMKGSLTVNGGVVKNNKSTSHGAGIAAYSSNVLLSGGSILNNDSDIANGGGLYLQDCKSKFVGGIISGNKTKRGEGEDGLEINNTGFGGGVYIKETSPGASEFILEGSTISGNMACSGGGVLLNGGDFNMTGGEIKENEGVWHGGGICVIGATSFNITSGDIINNFTTEKNGGGIYFEVKGVTMNINGGAISNNEARNKIGGGVYVKAGSLNITKGKVSDNISGGNGGGINFNSEDSGVLKISGGSVSGNATSLGDGGGIYVAQGSLVLEEGDVSNNRTIKSGSSGGGIYFGPTDNGGISVNGGIISGNTCPNIGAGLSVTKGSLNIVGGEIHTNTSGFAGGGLAYSGGLSVTVDGGKIYNNSADAMGGGVYLVKGSMTLKGGQIYSNTVISNNTERGGGGIYVLESATDLTISGGKIYKNEAASGGGMFVCGKDDAGATLTITDGDIYENTARYQGGGLFVRTPKTVTIDNGKIRKNVAMHLNENDVFSGNGGGILLGKGAGNLLVRGGSISENTAYTGGGLCFLSGRCTIDGGSISNNSVTRNGAGIYVYDASGLDITNGIIDYNKAQNMGGGIFVDAHNNPLTVNILGGSIDSNEAVLGGGIAVSQAQSIVRMTGGGITNNQARSGGGAYVVKNSQMNFGNGLIVNNKAVRLNANEQAVTTGNGADPANKQCQGVGGGVCVGNAKLIFDNTTSIGLYGNQADLLGDDIFSTGAGSSLEVFLPNVNEMNLSGYQTATTDLQWMEDYPNGDTGYANGTYANKTDGYEPRRYREALTDKENVYPVDVPEGGKTFTNYLALALGYDVMHLTIQRHGLMRGENAIYKVSKKNDQTGKWETYAQVLVSGSKEATTPELAVQYPATKTIAVYAAEWRVEEIGWDWAYEGTSTIERQLSSATPKDDRYFVFTANKVTDLKDSQHSESVVINDFGRGTVVTQ